MRVCVGFRVFFELAQVLSKVTLREQIWVCVGFRIWIKNSGVCAWFRVWIKNSRVCAGFG